MPATSSATPCRAPTGRRRKKLAVAGLLAEFLPKLVSRMDKDQLKKLKLAALRNP